MVLRCAGVGAGRYIFTIWIEVLIDTRKLATPNLDYCTQSHAHWRLRTALLFLVWTIVGGLTLPFSIIGWFVVIPAYIWYAYRIIRGGIWFAIARPIGVSSAHAHAGVTPGERP